ncbi:MAG: pantetheine-phosphate adenylyltransferase [Chloroflexi bacterium]|nr:pantetheine-phosphate adenylyltransferase [Chloroflexota bacterium]
MVIALYPGTFDPVTFGHLDIVSRALSVFDRVVVAVYDTPSKALMFSTKERVRLFRETVNHLSNVEVKPFNGLMVFFAREVGAKAVVRGLRAGADFEYEFEMAMMNKRLAPDVESLYMMSSLEWQFLSSSRVKEVITLGGDVKGLVPEHVEQALRAKLPNPAS